MKINTPHLTPLAKALLVQAVALSEQGGQEVTVALTYRKQTDTRPRKAGVDYVAMPGVAMEAQTGTLMVLRRADNAANRRKGVVGAVYFKIKSTTRANGIDAHGFTNVRPEGITGFAVLGVKPRPQEA